MGGSLSDGQLGKSPHGGGIEKWAYVMLGNIKRGINEWEFGTDFACVHGWKKVLGFGADISKRLLKIRGGGGTGNGSPSKYSQKWQNCLPETARSVFLAHPRTIKR